MLGEVPHVLLDKITAGVPDMDPQAAELNPQIGKGMGLFLKAREMIEPYADEEGVAQMGSLIMSAGEERIWLELIQDKTDIKSFILKTEVLPHEVGGERRELNIFIKEKAINWGEKEAIPEQIETALKLLSVLGENMPPPLDPWERRKIREEMKLGIPFMIRQQSIDDWRKDHYD